MDELEAQMIGQSSLRKLVQSDFGSPALKLKQQPLLQANRRSPSAEAEVRMSKTCLGEHELLSDLRCFAFVHVRHFLL